MKSFLPIIAAFCLSIASAIGAPKVPADVVYKPTFLTGYDSLTAGTGFIARIGDVDVFLTAHHLFGPAAGLERDLSPNEAKEFAQALAASSMSQPSHVVTSNDMLVIDSARAFDSQDASHDVAAFVMRGYGGDRLTVATALPEIGDIVYLFARPRGEDVLRLVRAKVTRAANDGIEYVFDESKVNYAGTSGAPVLNQKGEVVGLNIGGGTVKNQAFGSANPAASFYTLVAKALKDRG